MSYYGSIWASGKTIQDRLDEHVSHHGAKYISQIILDGASPSEFITKLLLIGELGYVCDIEAKLAATNLWPKGLNGNAGKNIVRTAAGQERVSNAVSAAKLGKTKETSHGVARQAKKSAALSGENRTEKQKEWDAKKSQFNKDLLKMPPRVELGSRWMNNGTIHKRISPIEVSNFVKDGWVFGMVGDRPMSEETKRKLSKPKTKLTCPYCNLSGGASQMKRWHFKNCKLMT